MTGLRWCLRCVLAGVPLALLGVWLDWEGLMAVGAGLVALTIVGWPLLLLAGELEDWSRRDRRPR